MKNNDERPSHKHGNDEPRPRTMSLRKETRGVVRVVKPCWRYALDDEFSRSVDSKQKKRHP